VIVGERSLEGPALKMMQFLLALGMRKENIGNMNSFWDRLVSPIQKHCAPSCLPCFMCAASSLRGETVSN